ncbi:class I SAM-dependent methyltransferase [Streptomyces sp. NPDC001315]|uniref:class I SAM-dependent methyltransferase n=1 Tax=Streptomyces sp. NPDC001315 TaxID=3364562 RepID=UPI0036939155
MIQNPFLDPARRTELYGHATRLACRSNALMRAKTDGHPVPDTVVDLVLAHHPPATRLGVIVDVGCGRGTSTRTLAERLKPRRIVGLDAAEPLIRDARRRVGKVPGVQVSFHVGDFHQLPFPTRTCDLVVAAFCLYHSPHPETAIAEISRVLAPDGLAVLVTKSLDSYREMDSLVAEAGLDPQAERRESLYTAAHSGNLPALAATGLDLVTVAEELHHFTFDGHDHVAEYLATNPKYEFSPGLPSNPGELAQALHRSLPDRPFTTSSLITYVVGQPRGGNS